MRTMLALGIVGVLACAFVAQGAEDVRMDATRKKLDSSRDRTAGNTTVQKTDIVYVVKVSSTVFKPLSGVTVKYNIFYQDAQLGSTSKPDIRVASGSHAFDVLEPGRQVDFDTDPIKLEKASLDGGWYFSNGGARTVADRVVGIWLKAFNASGELIGEWINPTSVRTKQVWKD